MIGLTILLVTAIGFLAVIWRLSKIGDRRDWHGFGVIMVYAVLSYSIWAADVSPIHYFGPLHVSGTALFILFATKMTGRILAACFMAMMMLDMATLLDWLPLKETTGVWFEITYPDLNGLVSAIMLITIYMGAGDVRIDRPYFTYFSGSWRSNPGDRGDLEMDAKTTNRS